MSVKAKILVGVALVGLILGGMYYEMRQPAATNSESANSRANVAQTATPSPVPAPATPSVATPGPTPVSDVLTVDVGGTEPVWGIPVSGLIPGLVPYAFDVDGHVQPDPKNPRRTALALGGDTYPSCVMLPGAPGQPSAPELPESVRIVTPTVTEFRYTGRIRMAVVLRTPDRNGPESCDLLEPYNQAALANLKAIQSDLSLGQVRGVVAEDNGMPLPGELVTLSWPLADQGNASNFSAKRSVLTDQYGQFVFDRIDLGPGSVATRPKHRIPGIPHWAQAVNGGGDPIELKTFLSSTVAGRVTDPAGNPIARATVSARYSRSHTGRVHVGPAPVLTDAKGAFLVYSISTGAFDLTVSAPGFLTQTLPDVQVEDKGPTENANVVMQRGLSLRGRVVQRRNGSDVGVAGANVLAAAGGGNAIRPGYSGAARGPMTVADADGNFVLSGIPDGMAVSLVASLGLCQSAPTAALTASQDATQSPPVELRLPEAGRLVGRVLGSDGAPVGGATVRIVPATPGPGPSEVTLNIAGPVDAAFPPLTRADVPSSVVTAADGTFTFADFPASAKCVVEAQALGFAPGRTAMEVGCASPATDTEIRLPVGGKITGRVLEKATQKPLAGLRIVVLATGTVTVPQGMPVVTSGADGSFNIAGLPPSSYQIDAVGEAVGSDGTLHWYNTAVATDAALTNGQTQAIELAADPGAFLGGQVLNTGTTLPVGWAWVNAQLVSRSDGRPVPRGFCPNYSFQAYRDGRFEFACLYPGKYHINSFVFQSDMTTTEQDITTEPGEKRADVDLFLSKKTQTPETTKKVGL